MLFKAILSFWVLLILLSISGCSSQIKISEEVFNKSIDETLNYDHSSKSIGEGGQLGQGSMSIDLISATFFIRTQTIQIEGILRDSYLNSLPGAKINVATIIDSPSKPNKYGYSIKKSFLTDESGHFLLQTKLEGETVLLIDYVGYLHRVYWLNRLKKG